MITQTIKVNLIPGAIPPRIDVSQYDTGSRTIVISLYNGSASFTPAGGTTAVIQGTKPDLHGFSYSATISGSTVICDLTEQMSAVAGEVPCEIVLTNGSEVLGTGNFVLDVERSALSAETDISETEIPAIIDAASANATRAEDAAEAAEAAVEHYPYIGDNGNWFVWNATTSAFVDTNVNAVGDDGVGISSVTKTSTVGNVDTYTMAFTDGTSMTYTVTNGVDGAATHTATSETLALAPSAEGNALPLTVYGMSEQNGTPTPSVPVAIESAKADYKSVGKNLMPYPYYNGDSHTTNGITFTVNNDKSITISGTASSTAFFRISYYSGDTHAQLIGGSYILSASGKSDITYQIRDSTNAAIVEANTSDATVTVADGDYDVVIRVEKGATYTTPYTLYPMLRLASVTDSSYEPYKSSTVTTDLTLRAIEVASTDDYNLVRDGKYYIADTVDWVDGEYVVTRRIGETTLLSASGWTVSDLGGTGQRYLCSNLLSGNTGILISSHFVKGANPEDAWGYVRSSGTNNANLIVGDGGSTHQFASLDDFKTWLTSNPVTVDYILATPTTETLTAEQASALLSMRTYDTATLITPTGDVAPTTTVEYATERVPALALSGNNAKGELDALKCDQATAGTYFLQATVNASGAVSYSWVSTT